MAHFLDRPRLMTEGASPKDGVPDMTVISEIDEHGINENLKVRYNQERIYTYTGSILVAVNPYKQLTIYEQDTIDRYDGKKMADMPPHVFATAESALTYLKDERRNQSCIISGESGAGKTETTKFILQYLCNVTCSVTRWVEQQILEANTVLEAFGNAKTVRNDNSSRFGKFIQVCFDSRTQISGCIIQDYLLELSRLSFQAKGERNYHIFYQLLAGGALNPDMKRELFLEPHSAYTYLNQSGCYTLDGVSDSEMFDQLRLALQVLYMSDEMIAGMFRTLSAILWIGNLEFQDTESEACQLTRRDEEIVKKVAVLLGIGEAQVRKVCTIRQISVRGTTTDIALKYSEARENRHAMSKALYSRTFTWIVHQINSCTNPGAESRRFIGVLDIFGFENFVVNSFEQLCINFTNEKLHKFFNHYVFHLEQKIYEEEDIKYSHISFTDNTLCLELIEKPPKCVLKLLDEECRFPRATDESFLQKLHHELSSHKDFIKGADKRLWSVQFGIKHYAGPVTYSVRNFLEKNKDVQQELFFDYLETSTCDFTKDITKYRDLLTTYLESAKERATKSKSLISGTKTTKGKPTVGDTFRTQLLALVDVLDSTTPWYVRCLKPNNDKVGDKYDDKLVITQLRYSGMLDIVRIRREGYPIHVPAREFLNKYQCLADTDTDPLPSEEKKAAAQILRSLKLPETEWQIGKTKIFLRISVFDPLEDRRKALITKKMLIIQKTWRGFVARRKFLRQKRAVIVLQKNFRGSRQRLKFRRERKAAIIIQAYYRGMIARELAAALRKKKEEEEAERRRLKRLEEERLAKERAEKSMEESFKAAQMELLTLARMAEHKSKKAVTQSGDVDLDQMFNFLSQDTKPTGKLEKDFLADITADLEVMFKKGEAESEPKKPARRAPLPPSSKEKRSGGPPKGAPPTSEATPKGGGGGSQPGQMTRTQRRQRRVIKKLLGVEEEAGRREDTFDPSAYPLIKFAEMYFNDFPQDTSGFSTYSLRRAPQVTDPLPKEKMLMYTKTTSLPTSMVHMHDPENVNLACGIFKDICKLIRGDLKPDQCSLTIQSTIAYGIERAELRDEIFCQLIRQVTENPKEEGVLRGWHFLTLCVIGFPPSKNFNKFLQAYFHTKSEDRLVGKYAAECLKTMRQAKVSARKFPPSSIEIAAVKNLNPIICRFYFLDGKAKAMGVSASATANDVIKILSQKIDLQSVDGWALYEVNPEFEHFIKGHEYIADVLSQWERDKRSSMAMTKYTTVSHRPSYTSALGGGDSKFVFRKRIFRRPKEIPEDPVEYHLMYAQAVHSTVKASLQSEVTPDPMAADQTWPSEQELREAETTRREKVVSKRVPKGTSEYQAAWILDSDSEQEGEEEDSDMDEGEEPAAEEEAWSESEGEEFEELCTEDTGTVPDTEQYDADVDMDAEKEQLERLRSEREHVQFPDEVDTPTDCLAKTRFQKYRGLKSFRSSPWNPLENLPPEYARIFQFENFSATKKRVLRQKEDEGALPGWYVTVHVSNVPKDYAGRISSPLVVFGLLPHENKMSVQHYVVRRTSNYTLPIKSKDRLVFHTGLRRYSARPIFSQHSAGDKHKFERFLPSDGCYVASVYAPISYPPQPLLLFLHQEMQGGGERSVLVGTGSLNRVQPQRVICKRIVLSGHPYKINKKAAVIRYMFFNREDILWYKPVELRTKYGRRGHIKEPLGTHGHMKCVFDGHLKAQDTVLMYLYKRVYPKWGYCSDVPAPVAWQPGTNSGSHEPDQEPM